MQTGKTAFALIISLLLFGGSCPRTLVSVSHADIILAPKGTTSGAYFKITNAADKADTLYSVKADFAEMAQLHTTYHEKGLVGMREVKFVVVPAKSSIEFEPGGYHVMLMNVREDLKIGMKVSLELMFKHSGTVKVQAIVKSQF